MSRTPNLHQSKSHQSKSHQSKSHQSKSHQTTFRIVGLSVGLIAWGIFISGLLAGGAARLWAMPGSEPGSATHRVVHIRPGTLEAPLDPKGWVVEASATYTVEVLRAPEWGSWEDWVYSPQPAFWQVGMDRVELHVTEHHDDETVSRQVTLVLVAGKIHEATQTLEGFEGTNGNVAGLGAEWILDGDLNNLEITDQALTGAYSLRATFDDDISNIRRFIEGIFGEPNGSDAVEADGVASIDPTGGQGADFEGSASTAILGLDLDGARQASIEIQRFGNNIELRGRIEAATFGCNPCATPWRAVPMSTPFTFHLRLGAVVDGHPGATGRVMQIAINALDGSFSWTDGLDGSQPGTLAGTELVFGNSLGGFAMPESTGVDVTLDSLDVGHQLIERGHERLVLENFEAGAWDGTWSTIGSLSVVASALQGSWAARYSIVLRADGTAPSGYLARDLLPSYPGFVASLELGLEAANLEDGDRMTVMRGTTSTYADRVFEVRVRRFGPDTKLRAVSWDRAGHPIGTAWMTVTGDRVPIAVRWQPSTAPYVDDGSIELWSGDKSASASGIDYGDRAVEHVRVGVIGYREGVASPSEDGGHVLLDSIVVVH